MKLLKWCLQGDKEQWHMYAYEESHWNLELNLSVEQPSHFCHFLRWVQSPIEFAIVGLYLPYLQGLYTFMPYIHIVIEPEMLYRFAMHFFEIPTQVLDEIAVGLDNQVREEKKEIQDFLKCFYASCSVEEARSCYEAWQLERSLWNEAGNQLLLIMNLYENEIFNYFKYKSSLVEVMGNVISEEEYKS